MKKSILNLGKALNKAEQKLINGGARGACFHFMPCTNSYQCGPKHCQLACSNDLGAHGNFKCLGI